MTCCPWIDWRPMSEFFGYPSRPWEHSPQYLFYGKFVATGAPHIYIGTCIADENGYRFYEGDWDVCAPTHFAALVKPWVEGED